MIKKKDHNQDGFGTQIGKYFSVTWPILTHAEKNKLIEIINKNDKNFRAEYLKELKALAVAKNIKIEEDQEGI